MEIAKKISALKNTLDMTTQELSEKSGVPVGTLNKILNGETRNPTMKTLDRIAAALGVSTEFFFDRHADQNDDPDEEQLIEQLHSWLVSVGYIKEGEDITVQQLGVLSGIVQIIEASFGK